VQALRTVYNVAGKQIPDGKIRILTPAFSMDDQFQKTGFTGDFRSESILISMDIAASVKVAISVALIPRTIIAHSSYDIIVILHCHTI
jgi:hypothetical protein